MRITIKTIDAKSMQLLGFTPTPSYFVVFTSPSANGEARFVPASGNAANCAGETVDVEVNQERVSELETVDHLPFIESVVALPERGTIQVKGVVVSVMPLTEPEGNQLATVSAAEALFTLAGEDLGDTKLSPGDKVKFIAHHLSLWDEAI